MTLLYIIRMYQLLLAAVGLPYITRLVLICIKLQKRSSDRIADKLISKVYIHAAIAVAFSVVGQGTIAGTLLILQQELTIIGLFGAIIGNTMLVAVLQRLFHLGESILDQDKEDRAGR